MSTGATTENLEHGAAAAPATSVDPGHALAGWIDAWQPAWASGDPARIAALLAPGCHWRDLLALTGTVGTISGREAVAAAIARDAEAHRARGLRPHASLPVCRAASDGARDWIEASIAFSTDLAACEGVVRLVRDAESGGGIYKVWTLMTAVDAFHGHEELHMRDAAPGDHLERDWRTNWADRRAVERSFEDREPDVLVVGAGQAGLATAARLGAFGIDALVVDRHERIGDNWRKRYHALVLHNRTLVNHFPYLPFPDTWPAYIPKDKLADWMAYYAEAMELNVWTGTEFAGADWDADEARWTATLHRADGTRTIRARHLVLAPGVSAVPNRVAIEGIEKFAGTVLHTGDYTGADDWEDARAVIIGTGTSGHDVAQDLHSHGTSVTMVQRSPTQVQSVEPAAQLPYALYESGLPTAACDLIVAGTPMELVRAGQAQCFRDAVALDRDLLDRLTEAGFRIDDDTENSHNWQILYLTRGGGYYFNVGCSDLIADGDIRLLQMADIEDFEADGLRLADGTLVPADLILTATGYQGISAVTRKLLGDEIADRVGQVWGIDDDTQELANMWRPTPQPGLWFMAGSFAQCRIYSKVLTLQIQAALEGIGRR